MPLHANSSLPSLAARVASSQRGEQCRDADAELRDVVVDIGEEDGNQLEDDAMCQRELELTCDSRVGVVAEPELAERRAARAHDGDDAGS